MEHHEFDRLLRRNGLEISTDRWLQLHEYISALLEWNKRVNLISRRDEENIWPAHIIHSIAPLLLLDIPHGVRALDLGTGGGLPGVPLALVHGHLEMVLLDSIQKKIAAVRSIIQQIELPGLTAVAGRAEEIADGIGHSGSYDLVLARGVAPLGDLIRWSRPFLARRTLPPTRFRQSVMDRRTELHFPYLLAYKGGDLEAEIRKARLRAGGTTITEIAIHFSGSEDLGLIDKKLVVVEFH